MKQRLERQYIAQLVPGEVRNYNEDLEDSDKSRWCCAWQDYYSSPCRCNLQKLRERVGGSGEAFGELSAADWSLPIFKIQSRAPKPRPYSARAQ